MQGVDRFLGFLRFRPDRLPPVHFFLLLLIVLCLFISRFTLTVSMILLMLATAGSLIQVPDANAPDRRTNHALLWMPALIAVLYAVSLAWSDHFVVGLTALKVKALFVVLPFTLWYLRPLAEKQQSAVWHLLIACCLTGAAWSILQIPLRELDLSGMYARGAVLPTVIHHIRFSLLCAFATVLCFTLAFREPVLRWWPRPVYFALGLALTVYLHVLAVRSGLAGLYIGLIVIVIPWLANGKRLAAKAFLVILTIALFVTAYQTVPTLRSKIDYTLWSLQLYQQGNENAGAYSDSRRLFSYEAALDVIRSEPWRGAGVGDVRSEVEAYYRAHHPQLTDYVQPHNQYLWTAAAIGIPGAFFLLTFNIALLGAAIRRKNWPIVAFNAIWMASFLVEDTLEMQIGVAAYLFFNYLGISETQNPAA